jgi:hypothetical protein
MEIGNFEPGVQEVQIVALQKTTNNQVGTLGDTEKGVTDDAGNIGPSADTYTYTFTYDDEIPEVEKIER